MDIATHPLRAWQEGVRFIPTLQSAGKTLTGLLLSRRDIQTYLTDLGMTK